MSQAAQSRLAFDADGVVVASERVAWTASEDILALFGPRPSIRSRADQLRVFGRPAQVERVGTDGASVLRSMHRLLMRARADEITVYDEVLAVIATLSIKPLLITAAYADGIRQALGGRAALFEGLIGREGGAKEMLLAEAAREGLTWFVTDTVRDLERCRACGVRCIAVGWGYDAPADLKCVNPEFFVSNPEELAHVLSGLGFLKAEVV